MNERERQRTAAVISAMHAAVEAQQRAIEAAKLLDQERRLEGSAGIVVPGCEVRLRRARQAEGEALEAFSRALRDWIALPESAPRATPEP